MKLRGTVYIIDAEGGIRRQVMTLEAHTAAEFMATMEAAARNSGMVAQFGPIGEPWKRDAT